MFHGLGKIDLIVGEILLEQFHHLLILILYVTLQIFEIYTRPLRHRPTQMVVEQRFIVHPLQPQLVFTLHFHNTASKDYPLWTLLSMVKVSDLKGRLFASRNSAYFKPNGNHSGLTALSNNKFINPEGAMMLNCCQYNPSVKIIRR